MFGRRRRLSKEVTPLDATATPWVVKALSVLLPLLLLWARHCSIHSHLSLCAHCTAPTARRPNPNLT